MVTTAPSQSSEVEHSCAGSNNQGKMTCAPPFVRARCAYSTAKRSFQSIPFPPLHDKTPIPHFSSRTALTTIAVTTRARPTITASSARGLSLDPRSLRCASKGVVPSGEGQGGGGGGGEVGISMHSQQRLVTTCKKHPRGSHDKVSTCSISRARHIAMAGRLFHSHPAIFPRATQSQTSPFLSGARCVVLVSYRFLILRPSSQTIKVDGKQGEQGEQEGQGGGQFR
jgi:hypothetical protein